MLNPTKNKPFGLVQLFFTVAIIATVASGFLILFGIDKQATQTAMMFLVFALLSLLSTRAKHIWLQNASLAFNALSVFSSVTFIWLPVQYHYDVEGRYHRSEIGSLLNTVFMGSWCITIALLLLTLFSIFRQTAHTNTVIKNVYRGVFIGGLTSATLLWAYLVAEELGDSVTATTLTMLSNATITLTAAAVLSVIAYAVKQRTINSINKSKQNVPMSYDSTTEEELLNRIGERIENGFYDDVIRSRIKKIDSEN